MERVKYLSQLSEQDWLSMHLEVFGIWANDCDYTYDDEDGYDVVFWEKDGRNEVESHYHYYDFVRPKALDSYFHNESEISKRYFKYMAKKFGQEYINDFFRFKTEIDD